jgi:hypothetical protein
MATLPAESYALAIERELERGRATGGTHFTLRGYFFQGDGAKHLAKKLPADCAVTMLALEKCSLGAKGGAAVGLLVLPQLRALQGLFLCANAMGDSGIKQIATNLHCCRLLRTLRLDSNNVGDSGATALFRALPGTQVALVGLCNNHIGDKGAKNLARALPGASSLTSVNLQRNQITTTGARYIALAIPQARVLETIDLSLNCVTEKGERALRIAWEKQTRERKIRATFDKLDEDGSGELDKDEVAAMARALGAPLVESMGSIHLSSRKLDEAFAEMDPNGDGSVSYAEFRAWYERKVTTDAPVVGRRGWAAAPPEPEPEPEPTVKQGARLGARADAEEAAAAAADADAEAVGAIWAARRGRGRGQGEGGEDDACTLILALLRERRASVLVAEHASWALQLLTSEGKLPTHDADGHEVVPVVMAALIDAMLSWPAAAAVQQHACHALCCLFALPHEPPWRRLAPEYGACEALAAALESSKLVAVHEHACAALCAMAVGEPDNQLRLGEGGAIGLLLASLRLHAQSAAVAERALSALWHLVASQEHNRRLAMGAEAPAVVSAVQVAFPWVENVQVVASQVRCAGRCHPPPPPPARPQPRSV